MNGPEGQVAKGRPSIVTAALFVSCPQCGGDAVFRGRLSLQLIDRCTVCGLDFSRYNVGDGPAALLMIPLGALVVAGALFLHFVAGAPWWLQALIWLPLTTFAVIFGLRITKAGLLAAEHQRSAHEGRRIE